MNHMETIRSFTKTTPASVRMIATMIPGLSESRISEICRDMTKKGLLTSVKGAGSALFYKASTVAEQAAKEANAAARMERDAAPDGMRPSERAMAAASKKLSAKKPAVPARKSLGDELLDTTPGKKTKKSSPKEVRVPGVAVVKKSKGEDKRVRSVNGTQARLDALKQYVKENGNWTMAWGPGRQWTFKSRGKDTKTLTSLELAAYDGVKLVRWLNR